MHHGQGYLIRLYLCDIVSHLFWIKTIIEDNLFLLIFNISYVCKSIISYESKLIVEINQHTHTHAIKINSYENDFNNKV